MLTITSDFSPDFLLQMAKHGVNYTLQSVYEVCMYTRSYIKQCSSELLRFFLGGETRRAIIVYLLPPTLF